jgi:hypothetical protein
MSRTCAASTTPPPGRSPEKSDSPSRTEPSAACDEPQRPVISTFSASAIY